MGSGASKGRNRVPDDAAYHVVGRNGQLLPPGGREVRRGVNHEIPHIEERPRNTHDDLFSTDPFRGETEIRTIEDLSPSPRGAQQPQPAHVQANQDPTLDPQAPRNQPRVHDLDPQPQGSQQPGPAMPRAQPAGNRWGGRQPWLGRDGWPQGHPNARHGGPGHHPYRGYAQVVQPPRYEDVFRDRQPAPRPERNQPIATQSEQVPVLVANQNAREENRKPEQGNPQDVEVESLLSYTRGDEKKSLHDKDPNRMAMAIYKPPLDDDDVVQVPPKHAPPDVKVFKEDDDDYIGANLRFYRNEIKYRPHGEYIENIHKYWYGDYHRLEKVQYYIQWLFPLPERSSVNTYAEPLQKHETKYIKNDEETCGRVATSYQMMLDFFGMTLVDPNTGEVGRSDIWKERYAHLKRSGKNYFRITRIIRSLGALGFYMYQAPFVMFLLHEVLETKQLASVPPGIVNTWLGAVDNAFDREYIRKQFQPLLNAMNNAYGKKNVKIRVQDNVYYDPHGYKDRKSLTYRGRGQNVHDASRIEE